MTNKPNNKVDEKTTEHDFVGAGIFTYCKKCKRSLLFLGVPQEICKPSTTINH